MAKGLHCISKLRDPCYPATKKVAESGAKWQAGMLAEAPHSDTLMTSRLQVYAHILRQLLSVAGSWCKSAKTDLIGSAKASS